MTTGIHTWHVPVEIILIFQALLLYVLSSTMHPLLTLATVLTVTVSTILVSEKKSLAKRNIPKSKLLSFLPLIWGFFILLVNSKLAHKYVPIPVIPADVSLSVVIPARDESAFFIRNTIKFLVMHTPKHILKEIIIVDDASLVPISTLLLETEYPTVSVVRQDRRKGLISAKIDGAIAASGNFLMFLDAHCRVTPGYAELLLAKAAKLHYNDIIVPVVVDVDAKTFELTNKGGSRMMFDWSFDFHWIPDSDADPDDAVPVTAGGIFLISTKGFLEGTYDSNMHEWGGENIEQSLRTWMCGGRIFLERSVHIGHVFIRPFAEERREIDPKNVERNLARAAFVWLDDSIDYFETRSYWAPEMLRDLGPGIDSRLELRNRLKCGTFSDFKTRFSQIFEQQGLFLDSEFNAQDLRSGFCLSSNRELLDWKFCDLYSPDQRFHPISSGTRIRSTRFDRCLALAVDDQIILDSCDSQETGKDIAYMQMSLESIIHREDSFQSFLGIKEKTVCILSPQAAGISVKAGDCGKHSALIERIYVGP